MILFTARTRSVEPQIATTAPPALPRHWTSGNSWRAGHILPYLPYPSDMPDWSACSAGLERAARSVVPEMATTQPTRRASSNKEDFTLPYLATYYPSSMPDLER